MTVTRDWYFMGSGNGYQPRYSVRNAAETIIADFDTEDQANDYIKEQTK